MARTAKSVDEKAVVVDTAAANISETENMNEEENIEKKNETRKVSRNPLNDIDEINVVSLVPNVSYEDSKTGDMYEWDIVGHIEPMTFETLKNMWRNHKGYFREMLLKPEDERVITQFGLTKTFEKYDFLMDESSYKRNNIDALCSTISSAPNGLKFAIVNRVKDMVATGVLSDVSVIKALEKQLNLDLISSLE